MAFIICNHARSCAGMGPHAIGSAPVAPINADTSTMESYGRSGRAPRFWHDTTIWCLESL